MAKSKRPQQGVRLGCYQNWYTSSTVLHLILDKIRWFLSFQVLGTCIFRRRGSIFRDDQRHGPSEARLHSGKEGERVDLLKMTALVRKQKRTA